MNNNSSDEAQWNAVFCRVLSTGSAPDDARLVDLAIETADKAAPNYAKQRRAKQQRSERGRRWARSRPWKRTPKKRAKRAKS